MDPVNVGLQAKFEVRIALPVPEIIGDFKTLDSTVAPDRPCCGQPDCPSINLNLISRGIIFEVIHPMCITVPELCVVCSS